MVFDWFKRRLSTPEPPQAAEPEASEQAAEPQEEPSQLEGTDEAGPQHAETPQPAAPADDFASQAPTAPDAVTTATTAVNPAAPGSTPIDQDALTWARQAYARLKAQQQAASQAPQAPAPGAPTLGAPPLGAAPQGAPPLGTPEQAPGVVALEAETEAPPAAAPGEAKPPQPVAPPTTDPLAPPPAAPAAPAANPSLLELAAAQRQRRLQELVAVEPSTAAPPTAVPAIPAAPAAPERKREVEGAEPELGAFDGDFTWSAEVLAAQGRGADQVSIEEIDWLGRLRRGLEKTRKGFVSQLLETLGDDPLTPEVLDDLETTLLRADVGVQATDQVLEALRKRLNEEVVDPAEGLKFLKEQLRTLLEAPIQASGRPLLAPERDRLNVWLLVGVNGVGKTTTLGKLANLAVRSGYSCLIAAGDTFRAAAVQQVSVWGERSGVAVVANTSANADPAAVVYDAIGAARAKGVELVLVDTAGRLQTKHNLMEELAKVRRIVDKLAPEAAVESLLVLDSSQGQNGLKQAMAFASAAGLTGVVLTKLDGSSKGGVALAVASEANLPIRFIGAGEGIRDLRPFNSFEFVEALLSH